MAEELINISQLDHVKNENVTMWAGSHKLGTNPSYVYNSKKNIFEIQSIEYAAIWLKIFDEAIVNAMDHWHRYPKLVTYIEVKFDKTDGSIYIKNNGPSIGIKKTKTKDGISMWLPEMAFSVFFTSSNYKTKKRYTGGINGLGTKILGAFSTKFEVETVDTNQGKIYKQCFEDRMKTINEPEISDIDADEDYTSIKFTPAYEAFGYKNGYKKTYGDDLFKLIEIRAYHAKIYTGITVRLNNKEINLPSDKPFIQFAKMHLSREDSDDIADNEDDNIDLFYTKLKHTGDEPDLDLCIGVSNGKFQQISIINGVNVYDGGNLITYIQNQIVDNLRPKVEKLLGKSKVKFNKNMITNSMFIFIKGKLADPEFDSQIKNKIMNPLDYFNGFQFKPTDWKKIWGIIGPQIEETFLQKTQPKEKKRTMRGEINVPKFTDAQLAGSAKYSSQCMLWIVEGDSPAGTIKNGIVHKCSDLTFKFCGIFNSGGVIMNCRSKCNKKTNVKGDVIIVKTAQLENNERLNSLNKVLNLDGTKKYDASTEEGVKELATLRYGCVVIAVDQDVDGHGIYGLIINYFEYFWPNLLKQGFIKKFNTPIIRAFPLKSGVPTQKGVLEFYAMWKFKEWINEKFDGSETIAVKKYDIRYYKGLGSHEDSDIPRMFAEYNKCLLTVALDKEAHKNLEIYYGKDTDARKNILHTPADEPDLTKNPSPISYILSTQVKEFQRDKIFRSLPHAIDGLTESRRKVLWTARAKFGTTNTSNKRMKVALLASETANYTAYTHGEACLCAAVTLMAQTFPGSNHLPMLIPRGYFGSRAKGGKDAASPRYIYTQLNQKLCYAMYPPDDDYILDFVFDEGKQCEPKYFVPILPMIVLENLSGNIGVGWSSQIWARDIKSVIQNVRGMLSGTQTKCKPMRTWLKDNTGKIVFHEGKEYSIGTYTQEKKIIRITELPLGMYPHSYLGWDTPRPDKSKSKTNKSTKTDDTETVAEEKAKKNPLWANEVFSQRPLCETDNKINITFYLKEDAMNTIKSKHKSVFLDPIEEFFGLKNVLSSNLNAVNWDDSIIEFSKYEQMVDNWFNIRKNLYKKRIDRNMIILKLTIKYLQNIIRFQDNEAEYGFTTKTKLTDMKTKLEIEKYDKIDEDTLKSPKYTLVSELEDKILRGSSATYTYLLSLNNIDKSEANSLKRKTLLEDKEKQLKKLEKSYKEDIFPGASLWLTELDNLENILSYGFKTNWDQDSVAIDNSKTK